MGPFLSALHRSSGKQKEFLSVFSLTRWSKIINKNHNLLTDFLELEFKMISSHLGQEIVRGEILVSLNTLSCVIIVVPFFICHLYIRRVLGGCPLGKK